MRDAKVNQTTLIALRYKGVEAVVDDDGYKSGEFVVKYYPPKVFKASVSGAKGGVYVDVFGTDVQYDKTISLTKTAFEKLKFDDNTVFFIDKKVEYQDGLPIYDYRVSKIAQTKNQVVMAVKKVDK